jgi:hypothetical protein
VIIGQRLERRLYISRRTKSSSLHADASEQSAIDKVIAAGTESRLV